MVATFSSMSAHIPYEQRLGPCDVPGCGKRFMEACDLRTHKKGHTMKRSMYRGVTIERGRWKAQIGYGGKLIILVLSTQM